MQASPLTVTASQVTCSQKFQGCLTAGFTSALYRSTTTAVVLYILERPHTSDQELSLVHYLTFAIEEHFQALPFDSPMRRRHWDAFGSRVVANTERILELLDRHRTRATFFILGWVAQRYPRLVQEIARCGHEIASHGYQHERVTALTPALFREDVRSAKALLEDLAGCPVAGYRSPGFTITADTLWALSILVEEGHRYDSSIRPLWSHRNGIPALEPRVHTQETPAGYILEVPPTTVPLGGLRWPIAGGSCFRLLPFSLIEFLLHGSDRDGEELVLCFHAWEFDRQPPRMEGPLLSQLLHFLKLHRTEKRLASLLQQFTFVPIRDYLDLSRTVDQHSALQIPAAPVPPMVTDPA